jgi:hypothetical protein
MTKILRIKAGGNTIFAVQMLMLGNFAACLLCFSAGLRSLMLSYEMSLKQKIVRTALLMIPVWGTALYVQGFVWQSIALLFPLPIIIGEIVGRPDIYRFNYLLNAILWLVYSYYVGSYGLLLNSFLVCCTCAYALLKEYRIKGGLDKPRDTRLNAGLEPAE